MKRKLITIFLVALLVLSCLVIILVLLGGSWLGSYQVFTQERLVATVTVSASQADADGEYANVIYRPVGDISAVNYLFSPAHTENNGDSQDFKIYGDSVHIGGPIIKFHSNLILFNFETIYKVGVIFGRYNLDSQLERTKEVNSSYDLNGGIDSTWRDLASNIDVFPRNIFFDTTQISTPGVFFQNTAKEYELYITPSGFLWREV